MTDLLLDLLAGVCVVLGAAFSLSAAVGLLRFPDALSRLHAGSKPQVLGLALVIVAIVVANRDLTYLMLLIPVFGLQLFTQPVASHMVGRAMYRTGNYRADLLVVDELGQPRNISKR